MSQFVTKVSSGANTALGVKKNKKKKIWKIVLLFLGIAFVCLAAFVAYLYSTGSKIFDNSISKSSLLRAISGNTEVFTEDRINILVMGRGGENHPGGLLTDSIMVISVKPKDKSVALLSIPRDLLVTIPGHGQDKINSAYADGYNDYLAKSCKKKSADLCKNDAFASGANLTRDTASQVLGIPVQYYISADFEGFTKFIDSLGGVDVYVDKTLYDPLYPDKTMTGYEPFLIKAGQHHLDGATALKYARSRETTSDFDRAARQQKILSAIQQKASQLGLLTNPKKIIEMANIVGDHLRTNLSPDEIMALASIVKDNQNGSIISKVLSDAAGGPLVSDSSSGTYYLKPKSGNFDEIKKIAKDLFDSTATNDDLKVEILNGTTTSGLATKVSETVKGLGYTVIKIDTSKEKYKKSIIYNYSGTAHQKELTLLKTKFNADIVNKTDSSKAGIDASIIVGEDYQTLSKN